MKVYVAAPFSEYKRARAAMQTLREAGIDISHDWTKEADLYPSDNAPPDKRLGFAQDDMNGVAEADVVVVLTPERKDLGCGMWFEMGAAHALGKTIVTSGVQRNRTVFCEFAKRFETDEQACRYVVDCLLLVHQRDARSEVMHQLQQRAENADRTALALREVKQFAEALLGDERAKTYRLAGEIVRQVLGQ